MKNENKKKLRDFNQFLFARAEAKFYQKKIHIYKWILILQKHFEIDNRLAAYSR